MELTPELEERLNKLQEKYSVMGQDMLSYIDGLLHADYLTYWDYIHLDVLLNLQTPRTPFPDEHIFIMYHQVSELYMKLVRHALEQIAFDKDLTGEQFRIQLKRINSYYKALISSFEIMVEGMDKDQFLNFRMALLPASGFQSAQYRMIEIAATETRHLASFDTRETLINATPDELYENLYWKKGATELASGKQTLTLRQFEKKYAEEFKRLLAQYRDCNVLARYKELPEADQKNAEIIKEMREFDHAANVEWPSMHYKSAVRYLMKKPQDIKASGGTNWQQYLPARARRVTFFPELWSEEELRDWGRQATQDALNQR